MGSNVNIYLPPHAKTEKILEVILKVLGNDFDHTQLNDKHKVDFNLPTNDNNSWFLESKIKTKDYFKMEDPSMFSCSFLDMAGNRLHTYLHTDSEDGHLPICKSLNPGSTAIWCVVGKRLVEFFGGQVIYNDCGDLEDSNNCYLVENPKYPAREIDKGGINDRWHLYYNLLNNEPLLTVDELKEMKKFCAYSKNDKDDKLITYLEKYEQMKELEGELNTQQTDNKKKVMKV